MRIGFGFDVHRLSENSDFFLGGVKIPHTKGAVGHSDADVLIHAICDAMIGALSLGDIGTHFPDTDQSIKGIDSKVILAKVMELITKKNYFVVNIDSTVCLEKPKVMKYASQMKILISAICKIGADDVSIKATTNEQLGFIGREEGIAAYAVVLLDSKK
ncbi:MAG: 2-C-methyl-D-erythritol 2,4-cyclodiphosphate synthase [Bacteroidia bacterium]